MRMANPAMAIKIGMMAKRNRWRRRSEKAAINMENPNAAAHGGTECSCVPMLPYP